MKRKREKEDPSPDQIQCSGQPYKIEANHEKKEHDRSNRSLNSFRFMYLRKGVRDQTIREGELPADEHSQTVSKE